MQSTTADSVGTTAGSQTFAGMKTLGEVLQEAMDLVTATDYLVSERQKVHDLTQSLLGAAQDLETAATANEINKDTIRRQQKVILEQNRTILALTEVSPAGIRAGAEALGTLKRLVAKDPLLMLCASVNGVTPADFDREARKLNALAATVEKVNAGQAVG